MAELDRNFRTYDTEIYLNDVLHQIQYYYEICDKKICIEEAKLEGVVQIRKVLKDDFVEAVIDEIKAAIDDENAERDSYVEDEQSSYGYAGSVNK